MYKISQSMQRPANIINLSLQLTKVKVRNIKLTTKVNLLN